MSYEIRQASRDGLDIMVDWAAAEGWNPGLYDADAFFAQDPKGFFLGFLNGEPISSISAVSYGKDFGFLGFYIVKPEHRGKGYGLQIWNESLKHLSTQNVGLDGVVAQQENYKKSGFELACRNIRYEGRGTSNTINFPEIVPLSSILFEEVVQYDSKMFPALRPSFLSEWVKQPESLAVGYTKDGKLMGYGMIRKCRTGFKVGPLFADDADIADKMFSRLRSSCGLQIPVFLDVPELNKEAVKLAERHEMKPMFETARMYTKGKPEIDFQSVFGVTSFELG